MLINIREVVINIIQAPVTRVERKKRKRDEYEQWKEKALQESREQDLPRKTKQSKLHFSSTVSGQGEKTKPAKGDTAADVVEVKDDQNYCKYM